MVDIYTKDKRSAIMSKISGQGTKPEVLVRKHLFANGFRYRKNDKRYPGKPDIVLPKYKTIILVHGCFWHGHSCPAGKLPETNKAFWKEKIHSNSERDNRNKTKLKKLGWHVIVIWQCKINTQRKQNMTFQKLTRQIMKNINH